MVKVGIVGGTGYTGVELLRILVNHPQAEVVAITSRAEEGVRVDSLYPNLRGHTDIAFSLPKVEVLAQCDVVFFATPHNVAMNMMPQLLDQGIRVVDLSADFRIRDAALWSQWYGEPHACPEILAQAVYGLPEVNREQIKTAQLVACPGCYPTSVQLGYLPLIENGLVDNSRLIANATSGVSGAGRQAKVDNLLSEVSDSYKAYGIPGHRHLPEIEQGLRDVSGAEVNLTFTPHLAPMVRGMHSTLYAELIDSNTSLESIQQLFEQRYANEPFVDVLPAGSHPQSRTVKGSNMCRIAVHRPQNRNTIVVLSVIDNLVKGASGQAVQNMNIMLGLEENAGLNIVALTP
ncbi:N-acetyl-gamma-glutamyl-phosphate reductase [Dasania sp. GY-MA-18]|uniref:N-acetyl-gamma-glutamyl-phosphate reductase n=1 Tax=Dasania phycosphaerae TaxID=2950436 RepID=A0A9J6RSB3_9GAMM|nr:MULTISPECIES: N-acetyl-gamma-glutamyl-phosphate reductase [Dasania]MCR8924396.1 N-acetyl-gamma-glutamyl-phosphate reductase [Dasania sp. GY-MA-18]MCZ0867071.1 N-acetyl-gamma-glutamyl-phosphate reductase [Dasania phycosphaerae]MCZ0870523.1 N-acetyl-gamma-glutamyl-phosphate reductase [Dasania phycosphaerae]